MTDKREWERYARHCVAWLDARGLTPREAMGVWREDTSERYAIWLVESLWTAIVDADPAIRFRGFVQATEYLGKLGGRWPSFPYGGDMWRALKEDFESLVIAASVRRDGEDPWRPGLSPETIDMG